MVQHAQKILSLQWNEPPVLTPPEPNGVGLRWLEATGDLRQETQVGPYHLFNEGCRFFTS